MPTNLRLGENRPLAWHRTDAIRHPRANQLRLQQLMIVRHARRAAGRQRSGRRDHRSGHGCRRTASIQRYVSSGHSCRSGIVVVVEVIGDGVQEAVCVVGSGEPVRWGEIWSIVEIMMPHKN